MSTLDHAPESEQMLRWRLWQEKCRHSDQLAERRMKIMFCAVAAILVAVTLYYWLCPKPTTQGTQLIVASADTHAQIRLWTT